MALNMVSGDLAVTSRTLTTMVLTHRGVLRLAAVGSNVKYYIQPSSFY